MRRPIPIVAVFAVLLTFAATARAQDDLPERRVGVDWVDGAPRVHFSAADLADEAVRDTLEGGLWQTLVMRVYAYGPGGEPIAVAARSCRIRHDPWPQVFYVEIRDARLDRDETIDSMDAVLQRCLVADRIDVGTALDYAALDGRRVRFAVLIELNPLSPETLQRLRRWLSRPAGGERVGGQAFFGSFVSLFVNRSIGAAERTLRFRSQRVQVSP